MVLIYNDAIQTLKWSDIIINFIRNFVKYYFL